MERLGLGFKNTGNEIASTLLQIAEHADLVFESLLGIMPAEGLVNFSIVADAHDRAGGVFYFVHGMGGRDLFFPNVAFMLQRRKGAHSEAHSSKLWPVAISSIFKWTNKSL